MKRNKTLYHIFILSGFILINAGILYGISQVIAYLNSGADRSKMLHLKNDHTRSYKPEVHWESLENPGRPMEAATQKAIEEDYLDAWFVKNNAFFTGADTGIFDHYTASARTKIGDLLAVNKEQHTTIEATTIAHNIRLEFYNSDGTLAVLTDHGVSGVERIFKNNEFVLERNFSDDYKIILLLEDGFWKIRHFEKIASHSNTPSLTPVALDTAQLEGINYYPQDSHWDTFGEKFSSDTLSKDFKIVKDLRLNSARIFVGYEDFGKAHVSQNKLEKLIVLLDEAEKADLKVIITLFDFYGDYRLQDWTLTNAHLKSIVTSIKDHPALLAWDLKNEPDLDFDNRGEREVLSWLAHSINYLKELDPKHPITIGWSSPEKALLLENKVDIVSYHYYRDLEDLATAHAALTNATSKPVVLQEFGMSSYRGLWNPFGNSKKDQANYYTEFFKTQKRDSIHYLSWTLFDFRGIPNRVAGHLPWRKNKQACFGIIDNLGVKVDAYSIIKHR